MNWIIIGAWIANIIACFGAYESSRHHYDVNSLRMNIFYSIANIYSTFYFILTKQFPYLMLQLVFLTLSIRGIINNYNKKNEESI